MPWRRYMQMKDRCLPLEPLGCQTHQGREAAESLKVKTEA